MENSGITTEVASIMAFIVGQRTSELHTVAGCIPKLSGPQQPTAFHKEYSTDWHTFMFQVTDLSAVSSTVYSDR